MKASFDGIRRRLATEFNELVATKPSGPQKEVLARMRQTIGGLLCMYDPDSQPDDCNCLIDEVSLDEVEES